MTDTQKVVQLISGPTSSGRSTWYAGLLACGHHHYQKGNYGPITAFQVGDEVECETCASNRAAVERVLNLDEPVFRARFDPKFGGRYHLYRRDADSPTGVMLITSVPATPEIDDALRSKRISPLSPTEERIR